MPSELTLDYLLKKMVEKGASDLHISAFSPPRYRIDGQLNPLDDAVITPEMAIKLCTEKLNEEQIKKLNEFKELDYSFGVAGLSRFRVNCYFDKYAMSGAFRALPEKIPTPQQLGLPEKLSEIIHKPNGLVLVTGATGSGKSTTIASLMDQINALREEHMITVEDPIEYVFEHKKCLIHQREVGEHTLSFANGLKYLLRQDPDIVLIGEMRDLETVQTAITVAETGHLVFATLHTNTAVQTIDRIIDVFPPNQQPQVRSQLGFILEAVLSQHLLPKIGGGRCLAIEMLFPNHGIRNLIREGKTHQIYALMQSGQTESGMVTMNQALIALAAKGIVEMTVARDYSPDVGEFDNLWKKTRRPMGMNTQLHANQANPNAHRA